jgi:hypothetical protein
MEWVTTPILLPHGFCHNLSLLLYELPRQQLQVLLSQQPMAAPSGCRTLTDNLENRHTTGQQHIYSGSLFG